MTDHPLIGVEYEVTGHDVEYHSDLYMGMGLVPIGYDNAGDLIVRHYADQNDSHELRSQDGSKTPAHAGRSHENGARVSWHEQDFVDHATAGRIEEVR